MCYFDPKIEFILKRETSDYNRYRDNNRQRNLTLFLNSNILLETRVTFISPVDLTDERYFQTGFTILVLLIRKTDLN